MMELMMEREMPVKTEQKEQKIVRVCFVCTGNTCRSPMAEAVTNAMARETGRTELRAFSAGLYANENEPIAPHAIAALETAGIGVVQGHDYHRHIAHTLTEQEAGAYDLLIGMTPGHVMELMMRFPVMADKISCMPQTISDPWGKDEACYRECLSEITACVRAMLFAAGAS